MDERGHAISPSFFFFSPFRLKESKMGPPPFNFRRLYKRSLLHQPTITPPFPLFSSVLSSSSFNLSPFIIIIIKADPRHPFIPAHSVSIQTCIPTLNRLLKSRSIKTHPAPIPSKRASTRGYGKTQRDLKKIGGSDHQQVIHNIDAAVGGCGKPGGA